LNPKHKRFRIGARSDLEMNEPKPDLATHERLLKGVRQEVRNLQVMQMRPGQSAAKLAHLADLERSARAEVKLRIKALAYYLSQQNRAR
jgi:hypothetical protein